MLLTAQLFYFFLSLVYYHTMLFVRMTKAVWYI